MEEDEDSYSGPTIEEIISSVAKRQSKFGLCSASRSWRTRRSQGGESSSSPDEPANKPKTADLRSCMSNREAEPGRVLLGSNTAGASDHHEGLHPESCPKANTNRFVQHADVPSLKMKRSVSTPELKSKYLIKVSTNVGQDNRETNHSSMSSSSGTINTFQFQPANKENRANYVSLSTVDEYSKNTPKLGNKTYLVGSLPIRNHGIDHKERETQVEKEVQIENTKLDKEGFSSLQTKRDLSFHSREPDANDRPSKIANTFVSPPRAVKNPLPNSNISGQVISESKRISPAQQITKTPVNDSLNKCDVSSSASYTKLTVQNTKEHSTALYKHVGKSDVQSSGMQENSAPTHHSTDNGYISATLNNNLSSGNGQILGNKTTSFKLPSNKESVKTPHSTENLQKVNHLEVNGHEFLKLKLLGRGGSSKVYEVFDLESHVARAIKIVELEGLDEATLKGYENEIGILQRLQWSDRVIKLYDFENTGTHLKLVMEKGNQDMASVLSEARGRQRMPISPFTIKHYWHGMLLAVQVIHNEGIIHSDLKPANFVLVNQTVKLIDFGISSSMQDDMTSIVKDSQGGTFNYMSPESILDASSGLAVNKHTGDNFRIKIGKKSDVWSLGCILYNLVYGKTPFQHIANPLAKLSAIADSNTKIAFDGIKDKRLEEVIRVCLQHDPHRRPSIGQLLQHPYLTESDTSTPVKDAQIKSAVDQLSKLTPNSLQKITSMMQKMRPDN